MRTYKHTHFCFQAKPISVCVTFKDYKDNGMNGHILEKLEPGNYLFKVRVTSLAGNGSWTEEMSFVVPEQDSKCTISEICKIRI